MGANASASGPASGPKADGADKGPRATAAAAQDAGVDQPVVRPSSWRATTQVATGRFSFASALSACSSFQSEAGESTHDLSKSQSLESHHVSQEDQAQQAALRTAVQAAGAEGTRPALTFGPSDNERFRRNSAASSAIGSAADGDRSPASQSPGNEYRIRFFNYNMANSSHYKSVHDLQGPGGRGSFADALLAPMADGHEVDIVFATLVETRLCMTEWVDAFQSHNRGYKLDSVLPQNARIECKKNTKSHVRSFMEGLAASYNGNLKSLLAFDSAVWVEETAGLLFGRLTEARIAGLPIPNPKKAFMGRTVCEQGGLRLCFVGAHFPIAKLAAVLEDTSQKDNLHQAKLAIARTLRKVLMKAGRRKIADARTALFVQGDLNSRTLLRSLEVAEELEFAVELDRCNGQRLGLHLELSVDGLEANITSMQGGLAEMWNLSQSAHATVQLRAGDHVVEVNGRGREDGKLILEECDKEQVLKLVIQRQATDVLLEVLNDNEMQVAIQHELNVPPGRWCEMVAYRSVHDLPVTYKFVEHVACSSPKSQNTSGDCSGASTQLTVGDVMNSASVGRRRATDIARGVSSKSDLNEPVSPSYASRHGHPGAEPYKKALDSLGDDKLTSLGLAFNKKDFRAFRFPSCADRIVYWAPAELAERMTWELPRGGYEVNHAQLGSDHRSVSLEAVLRVRPKEDAPPAAGRLGSEVGNSGKSDIHRLSNLVKELAVPPREEDSDLSDAEGEQSPSVNWLEPKAAGLNAPHWLQPPDVPPVGFNM